MNNVLQKFFKCIQIKNGAEALAAALFGVMATAGVLWGLREALYNRLPVYDELVAGGTVWNGYYKQGDMTLFYLLFLLIPFFTCLFLCIKHQMDKKIHPFEKCPNGKKKLINFEKLQISQVEKMILAILFGAESVWAVETAVVAAMPHREGQLQILGQIGALGWGICLLGLLYVFSKKKMETAGMFEGVLAASQLFLPFQFLGFYKFFYAFESEEGLISLFYSSKWKWCCIGLFAVFFCWQIWNMYSKKKGIYLSSLLLIGMSHVADTPEGILSVDFFHNGEMAFPMQQLIHYQKLPYFGIDPIHGMCDYYYSLCNVLFFDGSYFSQNVAIFVAELGMALLLSLVLGVCVKNKTVVFFVIYFFMPFLVEKAGVRYLFFFVAFLILFSEKVRKNSMKFLWWWVFLCIVAISWNVSIGSSMAVAFLPEILYRIVKEIIPQLKKWKQWESDNKRKFLISYGILMIMGISYIPCFLQILRFLSENAGTTLYVNGTAIFGSEFQPLATFAIILPYVVALIYALLGYKRGVTAWITMAMCLIVISNYACVRYDEGIRLIVITVFFMLVFGITILAEKEMKPMVRNTMLLLFTCMSLLLVRDAFPVLGNGMKVEEIPAVKETTIMGKTVDDPVVYVSGDSVQMPSLGTGFIQGSTLNSLKNIQTVLETEAQDEPYLDLTNKVSHYVIFNKESVLPFTSAYNISNEKMQEKAIALVKEKKPHLILLSPLIQFDLAPLSIRSMKFYESLIEMGYQPYTYEDVVYMLDGESRLSDAADGTRSLGLICHKEYMGMLPAVWGNSMKKDAEALGLREIRSNTTDIIDGKEVSYIEICTDESLEGKQWRFSFTSDVDGEIHSFLVDGTKEGIYLLPVGSSPFWQESFIESYTISGIDTYSVRLLKK